MVRHTPGQGRDGFLYLGSHNLSGSAWGMSKSQGQHFHCANYELGVLFTSGIGQGIPGSFEQQVVQRVR